MQPDQQARDGALAAPGFADQGECPARLDPEAHAVHGMHEAPRLTLDHPVQPGGRHVEHLGDVAHFDQRRRGRGHTASFGA